MGTAEMFAAPPRSSHHDPAYPRVAIHLATLAAVGGAWAVRVNQYGRVLALLLLTAFAATLLSRRLSEFLDDGIQAYAFTFG